MAYYVTDPNNAIRTGRIALSTARREARALASREQIRVVIWDAHDEVPTEAFAPDENGLIVAVPTGSVETWFPRL